MKRRARAITFFLCLFFLATSSAISTADDTGGLPEGWFAAGKSPRDYDMGVDRTVFRTGSSSGYVKSKSTPQGFGTLMQMCAADDYRGKRVRMTADIKAEAVESWAGMWMRVDGAGGTMLSFDNMQGRPIKGSVDWQRYEIVLDVPKKSVHLAFGVLLDGRGQVWIDNLAFEEVQKDVATTEGQKALPKYPSAPTSLDFE